MRHNIGHSNKYDQTTNPETVIKLFPLTQVIFFNKKAQKKLSWGRNMGGGGGGGPSFT